MQEARPSFKTRDEAISITKENGTHVDYYLDPEFEVHYNLLPVGILQDWHAHRYLREILLIVKGEVTVDFVTKNGVVSKIATAGTMIQMKSSIHRLRNLTETAAEFVVFRTFGKEVPAELTIPADKIGFSDKEIRQILAKEAVNWSPEQASLLAELED